MGACNTCACTEKGEIKSFEVEVEGKKQDKSKANGRRVTYLLIS